MKGGISMAIQMLKFSFDYCDSCLWDKGGPINHNNLPISDCLKKELDDICEEFSGIVNWSDPPAPSPWTRKQCSDFFDRAEIICKKVQIELYGKYEIINCLEEDRCMYLYNNTFSDD